MQKIAFFGLAGSCDYGNIGGTNSIVRRIGSRLSDSGDAVDIILYGSSKNKDTEISLGFGQKYRKSLYDAFETLAMGNYDHVVTIYLRPLDRIKYALFRRAQKKRIRYHRLFLDWNEFRLKRELLFAEVRLFPYNGQLLCISPRIFEYVSKWNENTTLLLPPVPEEYYCDISHKSNRDKIVVTYAGRLDVEKGTGEAINVLHQLSLDSDYLPYISGFPWSHKPDTVALHERLIFNNNIQYEPVKFKGWSFEVDENLAKILSKTDVLLLPYKRLSSTIDMPMLLLEGMASLCSIVAPPLGDLPGIYGKSDFILPQKWDANVMLETVKQSVVHIAQERERIYSQIRMFNVDTGNVTSLFRRAINAVG